jgi:Fur family ferric uptake transcriptional regulator
MSDPEESSPWVRLFGRYLREQGLPVTHQRRRIAEVVFSSPDHLSVDEIEQRLREDRAKIGKATIYRTLDLLVRSKLVEELDFGEGFKRYEHRLSREPLHHHLVCLGCGTVSEFKSPDVTRIEADVATEYGFRPTRHRLVIYGLCKRCQDSGVELPKDGLTCPIEEV